MEVDMEWEKIIKKPAITVYLGQTLEQVKIAYLNAVFEDCGFNRTIACKSLGISIRTLQRYFEKMGWEVCPICKGNRGRWMGRRDYGGTYIKCVNCDNIGLIKGETNEKRSEIQSGSPTTGIASKGNDSSLDQENVDGGVGS